MKRNCLAISTAMLLLVACNNSNTSKNSGSDSTTIAKPISETAKFIGAYTDASSNTTLLITKISADSLEGRSVVGSNNNALIGTLKKNGDTYTATVKELSDDKDAGIFTFTLNNKAADSIKSTWQPNTPTEKLKEKKYTLTRKQFAYNKNVGIYPQASNRLLQDAEVNNLTNWELEVMKAEILARHGFCFDKKNLRESFETQSWYVPNSTDVTKNLTDIEQKNIDLINKYEKD